MVPADVAEAADGDDPRRRVWVLTTVGGIGLLARRLTNPRIRATSTTADILILCILLIQCALGLTTIPFSAQHPDGSEMLKLVDWAQAVVTFHGGASAHLDGVAGFTASTVLGMTIFLIFPFTRLVHVWSAPVEYFTRRYRWCAPDAERWRLLSFILTGSPDADFARVRVVIDPAPAVMPGGGCRLTRPTGRSHRLIPVGPRKRSAAGQDIRHGTCNFAGWRLSPYPAYRALSQAHTP